MDDQRRSHQGGAALQPWLQTSSEPPPLRATVKPPAPHHLWESLVHGNPGSASWELSFILLSQKDTSVSQHCSFPQWGENDPGAQQEGPARTGALLCTQSPWRSPILGWLQWAIGNEQLAVLALPQCLTCETEMKRPWNVARELGK